MRFPQTLIAAVVLMALVVSGSSVEAHDDLDDAIALLSERLTTRPDPADYLARGELHRLAGHHAGALLDYARAERLGAAPATVALCRAELHLDQGNPAGALELLYGHPETSEHLELRSRALVALGRPGEALEALDRSLVLDPRPTADRYLERTRLALESGLNTPRIALHVLDEGLERLGPDPAMVAAAVDLELRRGRPEVAISRLDAAVAAGGSVILSRLRQGELLLASGQTAPARDALLEARAELRRLPESRRRTPLLAQLEIRIENSLSQAGLPE